MIETLTILAALVVGTLRIMGVKTIAYQAVAHVLVGFLFGFGANRQSPPERRDGALILAVALTVLELIAFVVSKLT